MKIEDIKQAHRDVSDLESVEKQLSELENNDGVHSLNIRYYVSGNPYRSYDVTILNDSDFLKTVKALIKDHLERKQKTLEKKLEAI